MELKFKHCSLFAKDWIVTDDKIIYGKREILLSEITKISSFSTHPKMSQLMFTFWANGKCYVVDCWQKQENQFHKAVKYVCDHSGDPKFSSMKKNKEDMSPRELAAKLESIEQAYKHGDLSFMQYDALKAHYSGGESLAQSFGIETAIDIESKLSKHKANEKAKKEATRTIIKDAVVGGVVAGPTGAVIGAIVGKEKVDADKE